MPRYTFACKEIDWDISYIAWACLRIVIRETILTDNRAARIAGFLC